MLSFNIVEMSLPMPCDDIAISVRNLTKTYRLFGHPGDRIKQAMTFGRVKFHREFTALDNVSFEIGKGECVGIIGRNGSGKSSLLQVICGILKPTSGSVKINGRIAALLELGAGFNPEFTGRENVYFQGMLMGISREQMDRRFDEIAAFADIGEFMDEPVRTYSSGMFVRLAFTVAINVDPEILVVDEALAVGDAQFQAKCFREFEELKGKGKTIVMVSHAMEQIVRSCDYVLMLDQGGVVERGSPAEVIRKYHENISARLIQPERKKSSFRGGELYEKGERFHLRPLYNASEMRYGTNAARIVDCVCMNAVGEEIIGAIDGCASIKMNLTVHCERDIQYPILGLSIRTVDGVTVFGENTANYSAFSEEMLVGPADYFVEIALVPHLLAGDYFVSLGLVEGGHKEVEPLDRRIDSIHLKIITPVSISGMVAMECNMRWAV